MPIESELGQQNLTSLEPGAEKKLRVGTIVFVGLGFAALFVYAIDSSSWASGMRLVSVGALTFGASGLLGMLLGFLFGIPRTLSGDEPIETTEQTAEKVQSRQSSGRFVRYRVNTNLEQISDWLTKILVGVGLTQLQHIPGKIRDAADYLGAGFPRGTQDSAFIVAVILYSSASGFFLGYLWTRIVLAPMFRLADEKLHERIQQAKETAEQIEQQAKDTVQETRAKLADLDDTLRAMNDYLYQYEREGFRQTIELATRFLIKWKDVNEVLFWIRLAAAYAQKYSWEKDKSQTKQGQAETKSAALNAIDQALRIDPSVAKLYMEYLGNPEYPGKAKEEDDFEVFWEDADFQNRVKS